MEAQLNTMYKLGDNYFQVSQHGHLRESYLNMYGVWVGPWYPIGYQIFKNHTELIAEVTSKEEAIAAIPVGAQAIGLWL